MKLGLISCLVLLVATACGSVTQSQRYEQDIAIIEQTVGDFHVACNKAEGISPKELLTFIAPQLAAKMNTEAVDIDKAGYLAVSFFMEGGPDSNKMTFKSAAVFEDGAKVTVTDGVYEITFPMKKINGEWLFSEGKAETKRVVK